MIYFMINLANSEQLNTPNIYIILLETVLFLNDAGYKIFRMTGWISVSILVIHKIFFIKKLKEKLKQQSAKFGGWCRQKIQWNRRNLRLK